MKDNHLPLAARRRIQALAPATPEDGSWYRIQNASKDEAKVYIYDVIAWFGIGTDQFVRDLDRITAKTIHLHVNSPGGDVFEGLAIYNGLKNHAARVITHVDGVAASIASVIAMAGDEVRVSEGAFLMIHNPWWMVIGESTDLRKAADLLDKIGDSIAGIYAGVTGKSVKEMLELMAEETWFNAADAQEIGFADQVEEPEGEGAKNLFDLSIFDHTPAELDRRAPTPRACREPKKIQTKREFETFLRDEGGFSHAAAKALAAAFKEADPEPRDEDGKGLIAGIRAQLVKTTLAATLTR